LLSLEISVEANVDCDQVFGTGSPALEALVSELVDLAVFANEMVIAVVDPAEIVAKKVAVLLESKVICWGMNDDFGSCG